MDKFDSKKKRRSKADNEGRMHLCDCGKSYFSYQALYTHKKTKHSDSTVPEEAPRKKRGRPKLNRQNSDEELHVEEVLQDDPIAEKMRNFEENERRGGTCDDVFAEYLSLKEKKNLADKEFVAIKNSIYSLRDCVNKNYEKLDPNNFLENDVDYTITEKPGMIPNICNFYIIEYLPKEKPNFDKDKEIQFMLDFCKWLNEKNYTELEIAISP